jgi:hypothetical protein
MPMVLFRVLDRFTIFLVCRGVFLVYGVVWPSSQSVCPPTQFLGLSSKDC